MPRSAWLAVGAAAGAIVLAEVPTSLRVATILAAVAVGILGSLLPRSWRWPVLAVAAGGALIALRIAVAPATPVAVEPPPGRGPWTMVAESVSAPRDGDQLATLRLAAPDGSPVFRVSATLPRYPRVIPGDRVVVEGRLRPRPDTPFGAYLERIGAWGTLDVDRLEVASGGTGGPALEALRRGAGDALTVVLPEPEAGLAAGILIGLRDRVDRDVAASFTTAGVSHVVAISGWNIAIVAAAIGAVAGRLGRRRRAIVTIVAIVAYVAFAGASPSVLRAGAMAGIVLLARETGRSGRAPAALGWAATGLLVADPGLVGDAGFQLSTLATAGLIAWGSAATERIDRWTRGHAPRWLAESLGVSMAAQLATLPIVVASFGRIALVAPAVNLAVVPLVAPVMAAGLVALAGGALVGLGLPAGIGAALAVPAWVGMRLMIAIIDVAAGLPGASLTVEPPWDAAAAAGITAAILAIVVGRRRGRPRGRRDATAASAAATRTTPATGAGRANRLAALTLIVAVACLGAVATSRPTGVARLTVLDVGQGDAILVEGSRGGRLLVDGGPDPDRLLVELDRRLPPWDRRLDVVVLSHPHEDHVAGLAMLLERYAVGQVLEPGMRGPGPGYAAWSAALARADAPTRGTIAAGDRLAVDDVRIEVRWPVRGTVPLEPADGGTAINNVSVVLLGSVGDRRFLLTGDVEEAVDPSLLAGALPRIDVLKVAHHGSRTATTEAFLDAIRPRVAIASAGTGNPYGHPTRATIERLTATGARVYRTDVDGSVTVSFESSGPVVRRDPRRAARLASPPTAAASGATGPARTRFLCAIPVSGSPPAPAPPPGPTRGDAALAAGSPTPDGPDAGIGPALGYHRADAQPRAPTSRAGPCLPGCAPSRSRVARVDGHATPVRLGRRRPARRAARRAVRVSPGRRAREPARALGRASRPADGDDGHVATRRTADDPGPVRWRDAGRRGQPGRPRSPQRDP